MDCSWLTHLVPARTAGYRQLVHHQYQPQVFRGSSNHSCNSMCDFCDISISVIKKTIAVLICYQLPIRVHCLFTYAAKVVITTMNQHSSSNLILSWGADISSNFSQYIMKLQIHMLFWLIDGIHIEHGFQIKLLYGELVLCSGHIL